MKQRILFFAGFLFLFFFTQCNKEETYKVSFQQIKTIAEQNIPDMVAELAGDEPLQGILPSVAERLEAMDEITSARVNDDDIVITFTDGSQHIVMFRMTETEEARLSSMRTMAEAVDAAQGREGGRRVIVWEPFRTEYAAHSACIDSIDQVILPPLSGVQVDSVINDECTIQSIRRLFDHDLVFIHTHGAAGGGWIATHEQATDAAKERYADLIQAGYVATGSIEEYNDSFQCLHNISVFIVSAAYLRSFEQSFDNAVVYGGYCHSMDNNAPMCRAFRELGADQFFGYQGSVNTSFNARIARLFAKKYCVDGLSAKSAYEFVHSAIPDDPVIVYSYSFPFGITTTPNKFLKDGDDDVWFGEAPEPGVDDPAPEGAIEASFTVGPEHRVYFSKGNLQYQASSNTWRFAERQYDRIGNANTNASPYYSGWIDLYCWGTSGWNSGAAQYQPYSASTSYNSYYTGGSWEQSLVGDYADADWAYHNAITNGGGQPGLWRCLTHEEYIYLMEQRADASEKYAYARVEGINGLVVLPDQWTLPEGLTFVPRASNWATNSYNAGQWELMESEGALFLPTTGTRQGNNVFYVEGLGDYWSSTACNTDSGHSMSFFNGNVYPGDSRYRHLGTGVRPVHDATSVDF